MNTAFRLLLVIGLFAGASWSAGCAAAVQADVPDGASYRLSRSYEQRFSSTSVGVTKNSTSNARLVVGH